MITNNFFQSLVIHRFQNQSQLMIIFATRGQRINRKHMAKKIEILKILSKTYLMYLKRKLKTCRNQIQVEKVWFFLKKINLTNFFDFFAFGVHMVKILFFSIFEIFQFFFWKMASMGPIECWKEQSHEIWAYFGHPPWSCQGLFTWMGTKCPFPCSIRLSWVRIPHYEGFELG